MNLLDENVRVDQRNQLLRRGVRVRQIGHDVGRAGMADVEILTLLHRLTRPTFFTLDEDFTDPRLRHPAYCIVYMYVRPLAAAEYARRVLRHPQLSTQAKRMGAYVRASFEGVRGWRCNQPEQAFPWP